MSRLITMAIVAAVALMVGHAAVKSVKSSFADISHALDVMAR